MSKPPKSLKRILRKRAAKHQRRARRFKEYRRRKNRLLLGLNAAQQRLYKVYERHKDFKKVKAPNNFSLIENTEESLTFISKLESYLEKKNRVFINLSDVGSISHGSVVVLLSIMIEFKSRNIEFNGNLPKNKIVHKQLVESGFFKQLYKRNIHFKDTYSLCNNKVLTHANKVVDTELSDTIISEISMLIWGEKRRCPGLQRVFIELMQNTNNHAYIGEQGKHHWWTTVEYSPTKNIAYFSFIDYGVGIIKNLKENKEGKFYYLIQKLLTLFPFRSNSKMLKQLLGGEIHKTSTGKYYRGKGLPCLFKACEDNKISNVVVISNDAMVEYATKRSLELKQSFKGTFIYWELNIENQSISN